MFRHWRLTIASTKHLSFKSSRGKIMKGKAKKQYKLRFKPTSISRLRHYVTPIKMVGDPAWYGYGKQGWRNRERAVYTFEVERKQFDGRGWYSWQYLEAQGQNAHIDILLARKWNDYKVAEYENAVMEYEEAQRDNAAWDYHNDNFIAV
jgi:hypothetical protein